MRESKLCRLPGANIPKTSIVFFVLALLLLSCGESKKETSKKPENHIEEKSVSSVQETAVYFTKGKEVYDRYCLVCHQAAGDGVPGLNPSLIASEIIQGPNDTLLEVLLYGSTRGGTSSQSAYTNNMPAFESLSNEEIANVASYIRNAFENEGAVILAEEVDEHRRLQ